MAPKLTAIPLRLGPLEPPGFLVRRSGMRWLCEDGHLCRAGEAIAYCNIGLQPNGSPRQMDRPFEQEWLDVQAVLAPRVAGRVRRSEASSRGGFLDRLDLFQLWTPDFVVGHLEPTGAAESNEGPADEVDLFMVAGRRFAEIAEGRQGLLTGWHDRSRGWRVVEEQTPGGVLSLGTCELTGVMRGDSSAFLELFENLRGSLHALYIEQEPLVPCARVLIEQLERTPAAYDAIAADLMGYLSRASPPAAPSEWIFAAGLLNGLKGSPLSARYDLLSRTSLHTAGPVEAVVLSSNAESLTLHVHRKLGYALNVHGFRLARAGWTIQAWVAENFDPVTRQLDDIGQDYRKLMQLVRGAPDRLPGHVLVLNRMSSNGEEDVQAYAGFDAPLGATLASVHSKDVNLLLQDIGRELGLGVIDLDAIAADMGGQQNLPDQIHGSGAFQVEVRQEILHSLAARGVAGFSVGA